MCAKHKSRRKLAPKVQQTHGAVQKNNARGQTVPQAQNTNMLARDERAVESHVQDAVIPPQNIEILSTDEALIEDHAQDITVLLQDPDTNASDEALIKDDDETLAESEAEAEDQEAAREDHAQDTTVLLQDPDINASDEIVAEDRSQDAASPLQNVETLPLDEALIEEHAQEVNPLPLDEALTEDHAQEMAEPQTQQAHQPLSTHVTFPIDLPSFTDGHAPGEMLPASSMPFPEEIAPSQYASFFAETPSATHTPFPTEMSLSMRTSFPTEIQPFSSTSFPNEDFPSPSTPFSTEIQPLPSTPFPGEAPFSQASFSSAMQSSLDVVFPLNIPFSSHVTFPLDIPSTEEIAPFEERETMRMASLVVEPKTTDEVSVIGESSTSQEVSLPEKAEEPSATEAAPTLEEISTSEEASSLEEPETTEEISIAEASPVVEAVSLPQKDEELETIEEGSIPEKDEEPPASEDIPIAEDPSTLEEVSPSGKGEEPPTLEEVPSFEEPVAPEEILLPKKNEESPTDATVSIADEPKTLKTISVPEQPKDMDVISILERLDATEAISILEKLDTMEIAAIPKKSGKFGATRMVRLPEKPEAIEKASPVLLVESTQDSAHPLAPSTNGVVSPPPVPSTDEVVSLPRKPQVPSVKSILHAVRAPRETLLALVLQVQAVLKRRSVREVGIAVLVGLLTFFVQGYRLSAAPDIFSDEVSYLLVGRNLANGLGLTIEHGLFLYHPPAFFLVESVYIRLTGIANNNLLSALFTARYLNIIFAGITAALIVLFGRKLYSLRAGLLMAALFIMDPYVQRINRRDMLETFAMLCLLVGFYIFFTRKPRLVRWQWLWAGIAFGVATLTKEAMFIPLFALLGITAWMRRSQLVDAVRVVAIACGIYILYPLGEFTFGDGQGYIAFKTFQVNSIAKLLTNFLSGHGQSVATAVATTTQQTTAPQNVQLLLGLGQYDTSYLLIGLAGLSTLILFLWFRRCAEVRYLIGLGLCSFVYGLILGRLSDQYFYFLMVPTAIILNGYLLATLLDKLHARRWWRARVALSIVLVLLLVYNSSVWFNEYGVGNDNGYAQIVTYIETHLPPGTTIDVSDDVGYYLLTPTYTIRLDRGIPYIKQLHEHYFIMSSKDNWGGFNATTPEFYNWVIQNGQPLVIAQENSFWTIGLYYVKGSTK